MKRGGPLKRRTPLLPRSKRRKSGSDGVEFPPDVRSDVYERGDFRCEVCQANPVLHLHHRCPRAAGGKGTLANALGVCPDCHRWIHAHPTLSYARGWLLHDPPVAS